MKLLIALLAVSALAASPRVTVTHPSPLVTIEYDGWAIRHDATGYVIEATDIDVPWRFMALHDRRELVAVESLIVVIQRVRP